MCAMCTKILIFDFDGTIADSFDLAIATTNRLAKQFNYKIIQRDELQRIRSMPIHKIIRYLQIPLIKLPAVLAKGRQEMRAHIGSVGPVRGLPDVLKRFHSMNVRMGILTSNSTAAVNNFLKTHDLQFFESLPGHSSIWGKAKRLRLLMKNRKLVPQNLVYIGDETRDIDAAKQLGIRSIAVTWGYNSAETLKHHEPDFLITNPDELLSVVKDTLCPQVFES